MPKYTVPVTRTVLEVYEVEARNATDAGVQVGIGLHSGDIEPTKSSSSYRVGAAKTLLTEEIPF